MVLSCGSPDASAAKDIVHDAEFYILKAQHGEKWADQDKEIEKKLQALTSPFRTAEAFNIEEIMDPRDTRPMLCEFVDMAQAVLQTQLGPNPTPYMP